MPDAPRPCNTAYEGRFLEHVSMPMGGLGAGMICLSGGGNLENLSWRHRPDLERHRLLYGAISVRRPTVAAKVLAGPVPDSKVYGHPRGGDGPILNTNGLPRHRSASFVNRFPFGQVDLADPQIPLHTRVTGWSPFVPSDSDASSLPVAGVEYAFTNPGDTDVEAVFSFHAQNPVDFRHEFGVTPLVAKPGPTELRRIDSGLVFTQHPTAGQPHQEGHAAIMLLDEAEIGVDAAWFRGGWFDSESMVWKAISTGEVLDRPVPDDDGGTPPGGSLYLPIRVAPGETRTVRVLIAWYVPYSDLQMAEPSQGPACGCDGVCPPNTAANYRPWYATAFPSIDRLAAFWRREYASLRRRSAAFADTFFASDLPAEAIEAVSCNLAILKSPTVLRQFDGRIWGWEGCHSFAGCCPGSCTHVWNYAQSIPHLFPDLERTLRETEFEVSQNTEGHQSFRSWLPIRESTHTALPACDGQLGGIVKVYRDWHIGGDTDWLRRLWPAVRRSLDYCIESWDPKRLGHITEPHHNTYDIEFWGPNGMAMSFYLAALQAAATMGEALGDEVQGYRDLLAAGAAYCDEYLYDGEYYIQKIDWSESAQTPLDFGETKSLVRHGFSPEAVALLQAEGPKYQYGTGCLSDGVLGEFLGWAAGLPPVLPAERLRSHLHAVHRHNFRTDLSDHANPQRPGYAVGAEGGLLLCSWPKGGDLSLPFVYSNEVWTGIEYQVAAHLIGLGEVDAGLEIVRTCRGRYDGRRRNPYDEYECGHWYARAMSSYALLQALGGLRYDAVDRVLHLRPQLDGDYHCFLATATGFGLAGMRDGKPFCDVVEGKIPIDHFAMA